MIVFSTVLNIAGRPTVYSVYKNRGVAFLNPSSEKAPILFASYQDSAWMVRGTTDDVIQQQVLKEITTLTDYFG